MNTPPSIAVIIPFFNEADGVEDVCLELKSLLESAALAAEVILLDDGSTDATGEKLDRIAARWAQCRVLHLKENRGQSAALLFGFSKAIAPILVTMDGDGQNDPHDIPQLLARLAEADMVVGWRVERCDSWARRKISRVANVVRSKWLGDGVSDAGCALKVFRREVAEAFIPIRTLYSFMPALAVAAGFRVVEEPVRHRSRAHGTSRYSVRSFLVLPIIDFIGLAWFRARRCRSRTSRWPHAHPPPHRIGDEIYHRALGRWLRWTGAVVTLLLATWFFLFEFTAPRAGLSSRKIGLQHAERIALQAVQQGEVDAAELRMESGRPAWLIDVQPRRSRMLTEITIDAIDGRILRTHLESPEEEAMELAAEDHRFEAGNLLKR